MPSSPPSIFVPATGGGAPAAPPSLFVPATGGGAPTAPAVLFVPATGGGAPTAPSAVFSWVGNGAGETLTITGSANYNSVLPYIGSFQGSPVYSDDPDNLADPTNPVEGSHTVYRPSEDFWRIAYQTSGEITSSGETLESIDESGSADSPELALGWEEEGIAITKSTGLVAPRALFTPAGSGGTPTAPAGIFTPATGDGELTAPMGIFVPATGGEQLTPPQAIFGQLLNSLYNSDFNTLNNTDGTPFQS